MYRKETVDEPSDYHKHIKHIEEKSKKKKYIIQKSILIIVGFILSLIILESSLRIGGIIIMAYEYPKDYLNETINESSFNILILGESTSRDWPEQLQKQLDKKHSETKYLVVNKAVGGITTTLLLSYVKEYISTFKPDMIITMMGINDNWSYMYYVDRPPSKIRLFIEHLRITKLGRYLYLSYLNRKITEQINTTIETNSTNQKLKDIARKYHHVALAYADKKDFVNAVYYYEKSYNLSNDLFGNVLSLSDAYIYFNKVDKAIEILEDTLNKEKNVRTLNKVQYDILRTYLGIAYEKNHDFKKIEELFYENEFIVDTNYDKENNYYTKYNYNLLYNITKNKNIQLVVMQYPTRDIKDFRDYFSEEQQKDIIFIENKYNFENASKNHSYEEIFTDKFTFPKYKFGHCTIYGDSLIATNVANVILNEVE